MDLSQLRPIDFRRQLDDLESTAITVRKRRNNALVRVPAGILTGIATTIFGVWATIVLIDLMFPGLGTVLAVIFGLTGMLATGAGALAVSWRYFEPSERKLLPLLLEPDAGGFLEDNWQRRDRLLEEAEAFNEALAAIRALPERTGQDENSSDVIANLAERRRRFEVEAEKYFADFRAATEEERKRVAKANVPRPKSLGSPHRQSLREFRQKVRKLAALERSLEALHGSVHIGERPNVDLSLHLEAQRYREELEEERTILIRCGLTPKKLPKLPAGRKALPPGK